MLQNLGLGTVSDVSLLSSPTSDCVIPTAGVGLLLLQFLLQQLELSTSTNHQIYICMQLQLHYSCNRIQPNGLLEKLGNTR